MNNVPDSAACNEAVKLVNKRKMSGLKGFVNGVLRNISRSLDKIEYPKDKKEYLSVCYSIPMWIIEMWSQQYGIERTEQILNSLYETNEYTTIRVDSNKMSPKQVIVEFEKENISVKQSELYGNALYIKGYDGGFPSLEGYLKVDLKTRKIVKEYGAWNSPVSIENGVYE